MSLVICDLESTSPNPNSAEIIEGHFIACNQALEIISTFELKCRPILWRKEAEAIHGITRKTASEYPYFKEARKGLMSWVREFDPSEFWCHSNAEMYGKATFYDHAVIRANLILHDSEDYFYFSRIRPFSTHTLVKICNGTLNLSKFDLDSICKRLKISLKHHNAKSDAEACLEIMRKLLHTVDRNDLYNYERGVKNDDEIRSIKSSTGNSEKSKRSAKYSFILQN